MNRQWIMNRLEVGGALPSLSLFLPIRPETSQPGWVFAYGLIHD